VEGVPHKEVSLKLGEVAPCNQVTALFLSPDARKMGTRQI
jgi:hypothetical protein